MGLVAVATALLDSACVECDSDSVGTLVLGSVIVIQLAL
jgi:hypothetical protein